MGNDSQFWMVLGDGPPLVRHCSRADAEVEARRLASIHRGRRFVVLEAVTAFEIEDVRRIELTAPDSVAF